MGCSQTKKMLEAMNVLQPKEEATALMVSSQPGGQAKKERSGCPPTVQTIGHTVYVRELSEDHVLKVNVVKDKCQGCGKMWTLYAGDHCKTCGQRGDHCMCCCYMS